MTTSDIKAGDWFWHRGVMHECIGTDNGLIWYTESTYMEARSADPQDCELVS